MVQILPSRERDPSLGQRFSQAIGNGLELSSKMYSEYKQKQQLDQGLDQAQKLFSNSNLSPEQRQIGIFQALKGSPELAKALSSQLSGMSQKPLNQLEEAQRLKILQEIDQSKGEEDYLTRLMGSGQSKQTSEIPSSGYDLIPEEEEENQIGVNPKRLQKQAKFDSMDASTWSDKKIDQLRSMEGKSSKSKTIAKMAQNEFEKRQESKKVRTKYQESIAPFKLALQTIDSMEKLGSRGNLGLGTKARGIISPQTRKDAAEYERLGKSLIQYASNIPIRNRQEFETLAHDLYDPSISDASREGILNAMKRIIQNSMQQFETPEEDQNIFEVDQNPSKSQKRPLTSFMRE